MEIKDIPKRKPRDYPQNYKKWEWIFNAMLVHAQSKRIWGKKIPTFKRRTEKGTNQVWNLLKKKFPYAFAKH